MAKNDLSALNASRGSRATDKSSAPAKNTKAKKGKLVGITASPELHRQIRVLVMDEDITADRYLRNLLNADFKARGLPQIA